MKRRQGFTIVELLVSMALILFIMAILSHAFVASTTTFRNLKAAGDMANKLRAATTLLQRDLSADHFEGNKRLSDPNFWVNGPPQQGFFQVYQGSGGGQEGSDTSLIGSYYSTNHSLAFTVKLRGNDMSDFLSAGAAGGGSTPLNATISPLTTLSNLPSFGPIESRFQGSSGGSYNYQWGEVEWFLQPSINPSTGQPDMTVADTTIMPNSPAMQLFTLYRRQRLLVPDNNLVQPAVPTINPITLTPNIANFLEMSCWVNGANLYFNNPMDVTVPLRRFGGSGPTITAPPSVYPYATTNYTTLSTELAQLALLGAPVNPLLNGADIQLTDVVSFDVRLLPLYPTVPLVTPPNPNDPFVTLFQPPFTTIFPNGNPGFYSATNLTAPAVFDTWSSLQDSLTGINLDGKPLYSEWNLPIITNPTAPPPTVPNPACIPLWNSTALTYQYPPGSAQTITLTGSGPIIQAIQISIRIWDAKTNQTRQVTIVQAM